MLHTSRGELSILLSLASVIVIATGLLFGVSTSSTVKKLTGSAQTSCPYSATAVVVKGNANGPVLTATENGGGIWGVSNDKQMLQNPSSPALQFTNEAMSDFSTQNYAFGQYQDGDKASVTLLGLNTQKYRVIGSICDHRKSGARGCGNGVTLSSDKKTISGFVVTCGVDIRYGWIVEPIITPTPTTKPVVSCPLKDPAADCTAHNLDIDEILPDRVSVSWDYPRNCPAYRRDIDPFWIDVVDTTDNSIVCSKSALDLNTTCDPSKHKERLINKHIREWDTDKRYRVSVYTARPDISSTNGACVSAPVSDTFTYTEDNPDPVPTDKPSNQLCNSVGQLCNDSYTESCTVGGRVGTKTCSKYGRCQGVGDGTKCSWEDPRPEDGKRSSCTPCSAEPQSCGPTCMYSDVINGLTKCFTGTCPVGSSTCRQGSVNDGCANISGCSTPRQVICPGHTPVPTSSRRPTLTPTPIGNGQPVTPTSEVTDPLVCNLTHVKGNGPIRVVIVPQDYKIDLIDFENDVNNEVNGFYGTNLGDMKKYFSFWRFSRQEMVNYFNPEQEEWSDWSSFRKRVKNCNALVPVLLINSEIEFGQFDMQLILNSEIVLSNQNLSDWGFTSLTHEIGHLIGKLDDEYLLEGWSAPYTGKTCALSQDVCDGWSKELTGVECKLTCTTATAYRTSENSVMGYNFSDRNDYNRFNARSLQVFREFIDREYPNGPTAQNTTSTQSTIESPTYHNALQLSINATDVNLTSNAVSVEQTYPEEVAEQPTEGEYYAVSVQNKSGVNLHTTYVPKYNEALIEWRENNKPNGRIDKTLNEDILLFLPYYVSASTVKVTDQTGTEKLNVNLADFDLSPPVEAGNLCGNSVCDAQIGETATSCKQDCAPDDTLPTDQLCKSTDVNSDNSTNTLDYAYVVKRYFKTVESGDAADLNCDKRIDSRDLSLLYEHLGD